LTVYDNVEVPLLYSDIPPNKRTNLVEEAIRSVGLEEKLHTEAGKLSGGQKQRVAIARAIINEPLLIVADEPTGNLDPETSLEILGLLKKINNRGTAVLIATHNYDLLKKSTARVVQLENGNLKEVRNQ